MKKIFLTILLLFACLNVVYSQNTMRIDTLSGKPGDTLTYSVKIDNAKSFVAYQLDVQIPTYLTYVNNSAALTGRANGHNLGVSLINPALLRLIAYSISMNPFLGNTGAVLTFKCYVTGNVPGTYSLNVVTPVIADSLNANILTASYNGRFVLLMPKIAFSTSAMNFGTTLLGTNKDLSLTIYNQGTSNLTISKITSSSADIRFLDSSGFTLTAGTNVSRTVRLYANTRGVKNAVFVFYSNDPSDSVHTVTATGTVFTTNELYLNTVTSKYGFVGTMKIRMKNFESVSAFQTSITLPASINYVAGSVVLN
ncbi:MAG: cohesin domain-containing protein, partial [Ignavibacteriota bacterium]